MSEFHGWGTKDQNAALHTRVFVICPSTLSLPRESLKDIFSDNSHLKFCVTDLEVTP